MKIPHKPKNNSSGYIGLSWVKQSRTWLASINVNGKRLHLGYYIDPKEAGRAYDKAALKHHGEFANLNGI